MRLAPLLLLAACSSPAPTSTTTTPPTPSEDLEEMSTTPGDDEPEPERKAEPDPPDEVTTPCLSTAFAPIALDGGDVVMCDPSDCVAVHEDGSFDVTEAPARNTIKINDDNTIEACPKDGACKTLKPKVGDDLIAAAAMDFTGARLALLIPRGGRVEIEVWDVAKAKRLAVTSVEDVSGQLDVGYVGDAVLMIVDAGGDQLVNGTLWGVASGKLKQRGMFDGELRYWAAIDAKRGAVVVDEDVRVINPANGEATMTIDWRAPLDRKAKDFDGDPRLLLAASTTELAVLIHDPGDDSLHLNVFALDGKAAPRPYKVRSCD